MTAAGDRAMGDAKRVVNEAIDVSHEDASYLIGRHGSTRDKLERVSGARIEITAVHQDDSAGAQRVTIIGDVESRARAKRYVEWLLRQRVGPIMIDATDNREDVSAIDVPSSCTAYVTGKSGSALRRVERETGTLMFLRSGRRTPKMRLRNSWFVARGRLDETRSCR